MSEVRTAAAARRPAASWRAMRRRVPLLAGLLGAVWAPAAAAAINPIVAENQQPGSPFARWELTGKPDPDLQGFATQMSINRGETVSFKIRSLARSYRVDVFRLGYYGGRGARQVARLLPGNPQQAQPACTAKPVDCGNWSVSAAWPVPAGATSGVYAAKLVRTDGVPSAGSHIVFVVRADGSRSDILFQTSDATWQAYNDYGGPRNSSLYNGAVRVSYNRPLLSREQESANSFFGPELAAMRFLERNGFDVAYAASADTARRGAELLGHRVFLSVGHDEYWSAEQRANAEAARDAGVHLAFLGGNDLFWKTRWESDFRTLVCYKQTTFGKRPDPSGFTGTWRDARFRPPGDPARPENALIGTLFAVNRAPARPILVPAEDGKMRLWRNTTAARLGPCGIAALAPRTLGFEWDEDRDNGFRPPGLIRLSTTTAHHAPVLSGPGTEAAGSFFNELSGFSTHHLTLYRAASAALVFSAGTIQWALGLDRSRIGGVADPTMQQAMVNLLADMGTQPGSLAPGLVAAMASTDTMAPTSLITSPRPGDPVRYGGMVTVTGEASDAGGGRVGGVEVSVDGGATWHPAQGRAKFRYVWMPSAAGEARLMSRAVDDSGNLEVPGRAVDVQVGCLGPCTLWPAGAVPAHPWLKDGGAVEVGVRFLSDADGQVTGIRFYKDAGNRGPHTVNLWSAAGELLASATPAAETVSGWQTASFATPVAVAANTLYVASCTTRTGYARDDGYFAGRGLYRQPLRAPRSGGVRGPGGAFPAAAGDANFWVDVLLTPERTRPRQLFAEDAHPGTPWSPDHGEVEVGVRFVSESDGLITGIRFYKGQGNVGPHVVNLWAPTPAHTSPPAGGGGRLLASGTAEGETAAGWQTVVFDSPIALTAGTEYVASYHSETGYAQDLGYFAEHQVYDPPLRALDSVYRTGPSAFPTQHVASANYWVDPVFIPTGALPYNVWQGDPMVAAALNSNGSDVEVGIKFQPEVDGYITGVRFFKVPAGTGPHTGSLWTAGGTELAAGVFAGETSCGWQSLTFAAPIRVQAGTTYVASYHTTSGFAFEPTFFERVPADWRGMWSPPLRLLADLEPGEGLNGVFQYGPHAFPSSGFRASNYWVDITFRTAPDP